LKICGQQGRVIDHIFGLLLFDLRLDIFIGLSTVLDAELVVPIAALEVAKD
jgi:hypothetical protein